MSAAAFVLAINLFVAGLFATAFAVLAVYYRSALGARWIALGYGFGVITSVLEFMLPFQSDARPVSFALFASFLFAMAFVVIGLARHYRASPSLLVLTGLLVVSMLVNLLTMGMARDSFLRAMLYQMPYALVLLVGLGPMLRHPNKRMLDIALMAILGGVIIHFLAKPFLAQTIGSGGAPQGYLGSTYAAISQSVGAVLHISTGIVVLLIMVRDVMAEITARSETDELSGLHNRRGFEDHCERAMALSQRSGVPAMMIVADLDHFKQINDTLGHAAGDMVIAAFAKTLREAAPQIAVLGRTGGEEFAIFLPGTNLACGRLYAEAVRTAFPVNAGPMLKALNPSASFGVAMLDGNDTLSELMRRADEALYTAKSEGRNRVVVAKVPPSAIAAERGTVKDISTS